jgi:hypothetical protein
MRDVILHAGIFGRGFSGKTYLAKNLSKVYWSNHGVKSLVLDPNLESDWGSQAWVTNDPDKFWDMVWRREKRCALFVEEAAESLARDNEKTSLFTRVRHRGHRLHVSGHSGVNLLPQQREQLHVLFLFQQTRKASQLWAETFMDERLLAATDLAQYEFLHCVLWGDNGKNLVRRSKLAV